MKSDDQEARVLGEEPTGERRTWVRLFVIGFVLLQALIPLRYYLGDDEFDERFSWRMFSAVRVVRCRTVAQEMVGEPPVAQSIPLMRTVHEAWVETLRRNREEVVQAFLARRCQEEGVQSVVVVNHCVDASQQPMPPLRWSRECASGEIVGPQERGGS